MEGIDALMRHIYLFPLVGAVLGLIYAVLALALTQVAPPELAAVLIIALIYKLSGINHADGLADFGDGVTAHTTVEKKISAMKDVYIGTGGMVFVVIAILAVFASLSAIPVALLPLALITAEVSAKQSMIAFAAFSRPLHEGFGQIAIKNTTKSDFLVGLVIAAPICGIAMGALGLATLALAQISAGYMVFVSKRNFGGSTGDGFGATNEISRAVSLVTIASLWSVISWMPW